MTDIEDVNIYQLGTVLERHANSYMLIKAIKEVVTYRHKLSRLRKARDNPISAVHKDIIESDILKIRRHLVSSERLMMRLLNESARPSS